MINPSELRLGSLINYNGNPMPVYSIDLGGHSFYRINDIAVNKKTGCTINGGEDVYGAIAITEEWLQKLGFTQDYDGFFLLEVGRKAFRISTTEDNHMVYKHDIGRPWTPIHDGVAYIHQLQNLYYALSGQDLTLNEPI
jgi:hypothetical protein